jgi:hypothetical protein
MWRGCAHLVCGMRWPVRAGLDPVSPVATRHVRRAMVWDPGLSNSVLHSLLRGPALPFPDQERRSENCRDNQDQDDCHHSHNSRTDRARVIILGNDLLGINGGIGGDIAGDDFGAGGTDREIAICVRLYDG